MSERIPSAAMLKQISGAASTLADALELTAGPQDDPTCPIAVIQAIKALNCLLNPSGRPFSEAMHRRISVAGWENPSNLAAAIKKLAELYEHCITTWRLELLCEGRAFGFVPKGAKVKCDPSITIIRYAADWKPSVKPDTEAALRYIGRALAKAASQDGINTIANEAYPRVASGTRHEALPVGREMLSSSDLAKRFNVEHEPLRKRLDRFKLKNDSGWEEVANPKPREPRTLFSVAAVLPIIDDMIASGERPAK